MELDRRNLLIRCTTGCGRSLFDLVPRLNTPILTDNLHLMYMCYYTTLEALDSAQWKVKVRRLVMTMEKVMV